VVGGGWWVVLFKDVMKERPAEENRSTGTKACSLKKVGRRRDDKPKAFFKEKGPREGRGCMPSPELPPSGNIAIKQREK